MLDSGIVGLAVGLILFFVLLSFLASGVNEVIEAFWQRRARYLEVGIWDLLGPLTTAFYQHHVIEALKPPRGRPIFVKGLRKGDASTPGRTAVSGDDPASVKEQRKCVKKKNPSYIPSRQFSLAVLDTVLERGRSTTLTAPVEPGVDPVVAHVVDVGRLPADRAFTVKIDEELFRAQRGEAALTLALQRVDPAQAKKHDSNATVTLVPATAPSAEDAFRQLEESVSSAPLPESLKEPLAAFLQTADRDVEAWRTQVEGWFDSGMERLSGWYKRRTRWILFVIGSVMVLALNADSLAVAKTLWSDSAVRDGVVVAAQAVSQNPPACGADENPARCTAELLDQVRDLDLPIGWIDGAGDSRVPDGFVRWLIKIAGLALTALAISLGASFWFDLLGKVINFRAGGRPPTPAAEQRDST